MLLRSFAEIFTRALAVGLARQRAYGISYSTRPNGRPVLFAIKRRRTSSRYNGQDGARAMERRVRQLKAGQLHFHNPRS